MPAHSKIWSVQELIQANTFNGLSVSEKQIAIASTDPKIKDLDENTIREYMLSLIGKTHVNCNFAYDKEIVTASMGELIQQLKTYCCTISLKEVELAFSDGYKRVNGDFFGLSNSTYLIWINNFISSGSRINAKKAIENAKKELEMKEKELTPEEKEKIIHDGCLILFEQFKSGKKINDAGNVTYNYLEKKGILNFTIERKQSIKAIVIKNILNKENGKLFKSTNHKERNIIKKYIDEIEKGERKEDLIVECKKYALNLFFKELIETDTCLNCLF